MLEQIKNKVLSGESIDKETALIVYNWDFKQLCDSAVEIRRHFCGDNCDMCTIINGKSGKCSENCKYCAQSAHYKVDVEEYPLLESKRIVDEAVYNDNKGVLRYSVVTSGKRLSKGEISTLCETYIKIKNACGISICASHGLLDFEDMVMLKNAGVTRYHNNLETSRNFFPSICTTHTFEDKIQTIKNAQKAGIEVCSGGIFGLGESVCDRIDMAFELKELGIKSVPVNLLNPIKGTPFESNTLLSEEDLCRIIAVYRFILPQAKIRLAGGRGLLSDKGKMCFLSGANAMISGDMLTTSGISIEQDKAMLNELNFVICD